MSLEGYAERKGSGVRILSPCVRTLLRQGRER
jgi:hypothetical protein